MKKVRIVALLILSSGIMQSLFGQDPSFSQFFSSPLNINPALTANINADWRAISNMRNQWQGPASPYKTGTISFDGKVFQRKIMNVEEKNFAGMGAMFMYDYAMNGVVKSTYASLNLSYNILLDETFSKHRLAVGFGGIYGRRHIEFDRVNFQEQFTGFGFNTNLPTGEVALSNMKPYISASTGITYSFSTDRSNLDVGVAAFHVNRPRQTFLEDPNQRLPLRKVAHANFETYINDRVFINTNFIYQYQFAANYFSGGGAVGYDLGTEQRTNIYFGMWWWSKNALVPYFGLAYKDFQVGVSYDITTSKLAQANIKPKTWELALIIRGVKDPSKIVPCPWK